MGTIYENILNLCAEKGIKPGKMCGDLHLSRSLMTDLKAGRKKGVTDKTAVKIAEYFGVSVDRVFGVGKEKSPSEDGVTFDDFTYAMHGHSGDLTAADKDILLKLAAQMADTNRRIKDAETDGDLQ